MVKSKIPFNTTTKINEIMKIRTIIRKELLLKEFMSRERGLLSHITMKYVSVGDSFTNRESPGDVWYSRGELKKLLMNKLANAADENIIMMACGNKSDLIDKRSVSKE